MEEARMNVYDFDGTIYDGDSTVDLGMYVLKKYPYRFLKLAAAGIRILGYYLHLTDKATAKTGIYRFITGIPDAEKVIEEFWDENIKKIYPWYLKQQKPDDVIISASPSFEIEVICRKLGITHVIASNVDVKTGKPFGVNNDGENKVTHFYEKYPDGVIDEFYSDSRHDKYLAAKAKKAFFIRNGLPEPW